eukprot:Platyproteum_vivax@DN1117_c0_g1_i1.p1
MVSSILEQKFEALSRQCCDLQNEVSTRQQYLSENMLTLKNKQTENTELKDELALAKQERVKAFTKVAEFETQQKDMKKRLVSAKKDSVNLRRTERRVKEKLAISKEDTQIKNRFALTTEQNCKLAKTLEMLESLLGPMTKELAQEKKINRKLQQRGGRRDTGVECPIQIIEAWSSILQASRCQLQDSVCKLAAAKEKYENLDCAWKTAMDDKCKVFAQEAAICHQNEALRHKLHCLGKHYVPNYCKQASHCAVPYAVDCRRVVSEGWEELK